MADPPRPRLDLFFRLLPTFPIRYTSSRLWLYPSILYGAQVYLPFSPWGTTVAESGLDVPLCHRSTCFLPRSNWAVNVVGGTSVYLPIACATFVSCHPHVQECVHKLGRYRAAPAVVSCQFPLSNKPKLHPVWSHTSHPISASVNARLTLTVPDHRCVFPALSLPVCMLCRGFEGITRPSQPMSSRQSTERAAIFEFEPPPPPPPPLGQLCAVHISQACGSSLPKF